MTVSNTTQQEHLKEIGSYLQQLREQQSITLDEVAIKTRIRYGLLQALEEGNIEQLPEPVFIQGFIRRYGEVLGLDGCALAQTFPVAPVIAPISANFLHADADTKASLPEARKEGLRTSPRMGIPLYVPLFMLVVAIVGGAVYLFNKPRSVEAVNQQTQPVISQQQKKANKPARKLPPPPPATPVTATNPKPNTPASSASVAPTAKPASTTPSKSPIHVAVNVKGDSWVRIVADGKTAFEGTLNKGKQQTWTANKKLTIRSGNAGMLSVSFNQKEAKVLGKEGQVEEVTFTPEQ